MDIIKNPIVIAVLLGTLTYGYMYWEEQQRKKKNPKISDKAINLITPIVVAVISWFLAANFFEGGDACSSSQMLEQIEYKLVSEHAPQMKDDFEFINPDEIKLPPSEVFVDLARF